MIRISKNHTSYPILVPIATLAVILVAGAVGSHQMAYANGPVGSHQVVSGNKNFFMTFPFKRAHTSGIGSIGGSPGDNGKQAIEQPTNNNQKALCITLGGNSPISASCTQISASTTSNTGGILGFRP